MGCGSEAEEEKGVDGDEEGGGAMETERHEDRFHDDEKVR